MKEGEDWRREVGFTNSWSKIEPQTHDFSQNLKASESAVI